MMEDRTPSSVVMASEAELAILREKYWDRIYAYAANQRRELLERLAEAEKARNLAKQERILMEQARDREKQERALAEQERDREKQARILVEQESREKDRRMLEMTQNAIMFALKIRFQVHDADVESLLAGKSIKELEETLDFAQTCDSFEEFRNRF